MILTMKLLREVLGENIAKAIKDSPFSVREVALKLDVSETTIHRWKSGDNPPDVNNLEALANLLMMDPAEFYKGAENVIPMYGNSSIRKAMVIPDEVINGLYELAGDEKIWEQVKAAILLRKKALHDAKKIQEKG